MTKWPKIFSCDVRIMLYLQVLPQLFDDQNISNLFHVSVHQVGNNYQTLFGFKCKTFGLQTLFVLMKSHISTSILYLSYYSSYPKLAFIKHPELLVDGSFNSPNQTVLELLIGPAAVALSGFQDPKMILS